MPIFSFCEIVRFFGGKQDRLGSRPNMAFGMALLIGKKDLSVVMIDCTAALMPDGFVIEQGWFGPCFAVVGMRWSSVTS